MSDNLQERRREALAQIAQREQNKADADHRNQEQQEEQRRNTVSFVAQFQAAGQQTIAEGAAIVNGDIGRSGYQFEPVPSAAHYSGPTCAPIVYALRRGRARDTQQLSFALDSSGIVKPPLGQDSNLAPTPVANLTKRWAEEAFTEFFEKVSARPEIHAR
jgi:hypothetical protein